VKNNTVIYRLILSSHSTEQIHFLPDILTNVDIPLAFEPLSKYIKHRLFSDNEPLSGDPSDLLQMHYKG
jgi:hypothetical protein